MDKQKVLDDGVVASAELEQTAPSYDYHYTSSQQPQIGGDGPVIGSNWTTAHDNPSLPGYISLGPGPLY